MNIQIYRLLEEDYSDDLFRSEISHIRDHYTDHDVVSMILKYNMIEVFWNKEWYFKAFYILALLDYLSDKYHAPYISRYEKYRTQKLKTLVYPIGISLLEISKVDPTIKQRANARCQTDNYGKYFLKYNIIELQENI